MSLFLQDKVTLKTQVLKKKNLQLILLRLSHSTLQQPPFYFLPAKLAEQVPHWPLCVCAALCAFSLGHCGCREGGRRCAEFNSFLTYLYLLHVDPSLYKLLE